MQPRMYFFIYSEYLVYLSRGTQKIKTIKLGTCNKVLQYLLRMTVHTLIYTCEILPYLSCDDEVLNISVVTSRSFVNIYRLYGQLCQASSSVPNIYALLAPQGGSASFSMSVTNYQSVRRKIKTYHANLN